MLSEVILTSDPIVVAALVVKVLKAPPLTVNVAKLLPGVLVKLRDCPEREATNWVVPPAVDMLAVSLSGRTIVNGVAAANVSKENATPDVLLESSPLPAPNSTLPVRILTRL